MLHLLDWMWRKDNRRRDIRKRISSRRNAGNDSTDGPYKWKNIIHDIYAGNTSYMENEDATYVEYEGEELTEESSNKPQKSSEDFISIRKDIFEVVGQAFKIPASMMLGSVTNVKDVLDIFLTFAVDPLANTISEVLNKRATAYEYTKGNYYKCYTGRIKHRDLFDSAANVEKIVGSSVLNTDEVREELELMPLDTEWSKQYRITKNFQNVEDATENVEGGENDG